MTTEEIIITITILFLILFYIYSQANNEHLTIEDVAKLNLEAIQNISSLYNNVSKFVIKKLKVSSVASIGGNANIKNNVNATDIKISGGLSISRNVNPNQITSVFNSSDGFNHISNTTKFKNGTVTFTHTSPVTCKTIKCTNLNANKINIANKSICFQPLEVPSKNAETIPTKFSKSDYSCSVVGMWPAADSSVNGAMMILKNNESNTAEAETIFWNVKTWGLYRVVVMAIPNGMISHVATSSGSDQTVPGFASGLASGLAS
jgi:hypothetical protein